MQQSANLPELLYIYDAYCAWCYGMGPVLQQVEQEFAGRLTVGVLSGGMLTNADAAPIGEAWEEMAVALRQVEQVTGAKFGEAYQRLGQEGRYLQDSEPPARALHVFRQLDPEGRTTRFAHDIQRALFERGENLNEMATYEALVQPYELDTDEFRRQFLLPATATTVQQEFAAVNRIGVQGFPTIILRVGTQGYVLSRGYQPYEAFVQALEQALQQASEDNG